MYNSTIIISHICGEQNIRMQSHSVLAYETNTSTLVTHAYSY